MSESASDGETVDRYDVLRYGDDDHRAVPTGDGQRVIAAHEREARKQRQKAALTITLLVAVLSTTAGLYAFTSVPLSLAVGGIVGIAAGGVRYSYGDHDRAVPELVVSDASERLVREHVDDFDPDTVSDPFN